MSATGRALDGEPTTDSGSVLRQPTANERARERVVLSTCAADVGLFILVAITAAASQSLTLLTEAFRFVCLFVAQIISIVALFAVHRARFGRLQYGFGKVEMLSNFMGCSLLVVGGLWILDKIVHRLIDSHVAARPQDLMLAALVAGAAVTINALALVAMKSVWTPETSAIFIGKYRARQAKFGASVSAAIALTLSSLALDPGVGIVIDAIGAIVGIGVMFYIGITLGSRCLCSLTDMGAPHELRAQIERTLADAGLADVVPLFLRTRRSGRFTLLEVELLGSPGDSVADLRRHARAIERTLAEVFQDGLDVTVVLRPQ